MTQQMHPTGAPVPAEPAAVRVLREVPFTDGFTRSLPARPPLAPAGVLAALAGGLLAVAAIITLGVSDEPSPWLVIGVGAALLAVGWCTALGVELVARPRGRGLVGELVPFATVVAIVGTLALTVGLVVRATEGGDPGESIIWWPFLLIAGVMMALWLVPGLQGRPVLLGAGLLAGTFGLANLVALQVGSDRNPFGESVLGGMASGSLLRTYDADGRRAAALVALGAGLAFLVVGAILDRLQLPGGARPVIVAGVVAAAIGAQLVLPDGAVLRALVPLLVAVVVIAVGIAGGRKATTWLGALAAFAIVVQLSVALVGDDPSAGVVAVVVACFGLTVLLAAIALVAVRSPRPATGPPAGPVV